MTVTIGPGPARDLLALARQGHWTNDPKDPNYRNHWNMQDLGKNEVVTHVYTGSMGSRVTGGLVNVRVADGPGGRVVYVDKPRIQRVGPLAKALGRFGDRLGTFTPARYEDASIKIRPNSGAVRISTDEGLVRARSDTYIGRSADLPPRQQLKNMWKILRV
jgi:hypothetical protein